MSYLYFLPLLLALCQGSKIDPNLVIVRAFRGLDLTSQLAQMKTQLEFENSGDKPINQFFFTLEQTDANNLAFIDAKSVGRESNALEIEKTGFEGQGADIVSYRIKFPKALQAGEKIEVEVITVFTHMLKPFPSHITQADKQLILYDGNVNTFSPYKIISDNLSAKMPAGTIESHTKEGAKKDGQTVTYGPMENVAPFSKKPLRLHFESNSPFLVVTKLTRILEISHWGNIAIEEHVEIVHRGAILKGPFSRYEFQRDQRGDKQPCVKAFRTSLPASARDIYYRDEIGNISTSNMRNEEDSVDLIIRPRFPLFGGWKTNYYIGYNVPTYEYLFSVGKDHTLKMRFIDHIYDNFVVDEMTVKIVLPEHSNDIQFQAPFPVKRAPDEVLHTYLDWQGRPVIVLHKTNLVENHIQDFELNYKFDRFSLFCEPVLVIAALYILFLLVIVFVRFDFTIGKDVASESRMKVQGYVEELTEVHQGRLRSYDQWSDGLGSFKTNKDSSQFATVRKKAETDLKQAVQNVTDIQTKLKTKSPEVADKINELHRLDKAVREQLNNFTQQTEKFVAGKLAKSAFLETEKQFKTKLDEAKDKMDSVVYAL